MATVSVLVPVRDERATVCEVVASLVARLAPLEVLVLDDGSSDGTAAAVAALALPGVRVLGAPPAGKSAALSRGIAAARGEVLLLVDGDGQFDVDDAARVLAAVESGAPLAIGTARDKWRGISAGRRLLSAGYRAFVRHAWGAPFADLNSGLSAVRASIARRALPRGGDHRALALLWGLRPDEVREVDVTLRPRAHGGSRAVSPLRLARVAAQLAATVWRVRRHAPRPLLVPGLVLALVAVRLPLVLASDRMTRIEEARTGVYASAHLAGEAVSLRDVWFYRYEGASPLESLAALPVYRLLGPSGEWLKLVPLAASVALALLLALLAAVAAGRRAAVYLGVLFVGAPLHFAAFTLYAMGNHLYAMLGDAVALACAAAWARAGDGDPARDRRRRRAWAAATGVACALAAFLQTGGLLGAAAAICVGLTGACLRHRRTATADVGSDAPAAASEAPGRELDDAAPPSELLGGELDAAAPEGPAPGAPLPELPAAPEGPAPGAPRANLAAGLAGTAAGAARAELAAALAGTAPGAPRADLAPALAGEASGPRGVRAALAEALFAGAGAATAGAVVAFVAARASGATRMRDGTLATLRRVLVESSLVPGQHATPWPSRIARLALVDLPHAVGHPAGVALLPLALAGAIALAGRALRRRDAAALVAAALPLYLAVYLALDFAALLSPLPVGLSAAYKYVAHLFPQLLLGLACGAALLARRGRASSAVATAAVALLAAGDLALQATLLTSDALTVERPRLLESDYTWLGKHWADRDGLDSALLRCRALDDAFHRAFCLRGIGYATMSRPAGEAATCAIVGERERGACEEGRGLGIVDREDGFTSDGAERVRRACAASARPAACRRGVEENWAQASRWVPIPAALGALLDESSGTWLGTAFGRSPCFAAARCAVWSPRAARRCRLGVARRAAQLDALRGRSAPAADPGCGPDDDSPAIAEARAEGAGEGWAFAVGDAAAAARCRDLGPRAAACLGGLSVAAGGEAVERVQP